VVTLVLPPLTQLNTPYPAPAYLARFLGTQGIASTQRDLGIELFLQLFSQAGLTRIFDGLEQADELPEPAWRALALRKAHEKCIEPVIRFLQGTDRTLAPRIVGTGLLPEGPRLATVDLSAFGDMGQEDAARHVATLYLEDLVDLVTSCVDPGFELSRYHHHLAAGSAGFDPLAARLSETSLVDRELDALADSLDGDLVGISVPFPGNLYGALRIGQRLKRRGAHVVLGGGYITTELREVAEPRLWDCVDSLVYDDGEGPLLALIEHLEGGEDRRHRIRTRGGLHDHSPTSVQTTFAADYGDLDRSQYLQLIDTRNPAHRLWADGAWNKITLAHGCYWKRCTFCDISLDYIARFEPARVSALADAMEELVDQTGVSGFHFVDEAAPPRVLRDLALEILQRGQVVTWWGNIRFEPTFTPDLCQLLAASGLVAVTGGLEVANDRLLKKMDKGVSLQGVATAADAFQSAGILVHAYLMYGFPTQTEQETVDAMEVVRQFFCAGALDSAFWHRFVLTRHSGMVSHPERFGIEILAEEPSFARNDLQHRDPTGGDHDRFDAVLPQALDAWMQRQELDRPVESWFPDRIGPTTLAPDFVLHLLETPGSPPRDADRLVWLGGEILEGDSSLVLHHRDSAAEIVGPAPALQWLAEVLEAARPTEEPLTLKEALDAFPGQFEAFEAGWEQAREAGLVMV
jgi:hypothetical protein